MDVHYKQRILDTVGVGIGIWLIGYFVLLISYSIVPTRIEAWLLFGLITLAVVWMVFRRRNLPISGFVRLGISWVVISVILDVLFLVGMSLFDLHGIHYFNFIVSAGYEGAVSISPSLILLHYALIILVAICVGGYSSITTSRNVSQTGQGNTGSESTETMRGANSANEFTILSGIVSTINYCSRVGGSVMVYNGIGQGNVVQEDWVTFRIDNRPCRFDGTPSLSEGDHMTAIGKGGGELEVLAMRNDTTNLSYWVSKTRNLLLSVCVGLIGIVIFVFGLNPYAATSFFIMVSLVAFGIAYYLYSTYAEVERAKKLL